MRDDSNVSLFVEEYRLTAQEAKANLYSRMTDDQQIIDLLSRRNEWTHEAAKHLVRLARENGIFLLRNALALAIALEQEDGTLGY